MLATSVGLFINEAFGDYFVSITLALNLVIAICF